MNPVGERLNRLREEMARTGVDAYLIPSTDAHGSEYVPDCWQRRAWISGFTGSAGEVVVTADTAGLWADSRYFLQAATQLSGSGIDLHKVGLPDTLTVEAWLCETLQPGQTVGVDPRLVGIKAAQRLEEKLSSRNISLTYLEDNLVDAVWTDQPSTSAAPVTVLEERHAGEPIQAKLERVRRKMAQEGMSSHVLNAMDAIAWLFNLRGSDVDYNPVFIAYAAVTETNAFLFVDREKIPDDALAELEGTVEVRPYADVAAFMTEEAGASIGLDEGAASQWLANLAGDRLSILERSPVVDFKAVKNATELAGIRRAHRIDGVAMVKFLKWMEDTVGREEVTELSAAEQLLAFRSEGEGFVGASFPSISGYGPHGAVVHYSVDAASSLPIGRDSLYLIDSGGQYLFGTTDITRTLCYGDPTDEQMEMYTRVLMGHISLATLAFPQGTTGVSLDLAARRPLWDAGRNYLHGTGHGIGHYLNVHEGPISISPKAPDVKLTEGHVLSNEPGYYRDGEYGIRTENLVVVVPDEARSSSDSTFYKLETVTRCPIDTRLIVRDMMPADHIVWLNAFHERVRSDLEPLLAPELQTWLAEKTRPI